MPSDFDARARDLFREYADPIVPRRDFATALRAQLVPASPLPRQRRTLFDRFPIIPLVSAAAVLALLIGFVGTYRFARQIAPARLPLSTQPRIRVLAASADTTRTSVLFAITAPAGVTGVSPDPASVTVTDQTGRIYADVLGQSATTPDGTTTNVTMVFSPLDPQRLETPQVLTLQIASLVSTTLTPNMPLIGPWQVPFNVTPTTSTTYRVPGEVVMQQGVGLSVTYVGQSPADNPIDRGPGGWRLRLLVTGLQPPPLAYLSSAAFAFAFTFVSPTVMASASAGPLATLQVAGMTAIPAALVAAVPSVASTKTSIAPDGTATLDLVFLTATSAIPTALTLHIDVLTYHYFDGQTETRSVAGPWSLLIPIH